MNILFLDIETTPALADVWGLFNVNVGLNQLRESPGLLCFSAKWLGDVDEATLCYSEHRHGQGEMVRMAHNLLHIADAVVTWNGRRFDIPHLNREFLELGYNPPAPYKQIDLYQVAKRQFRFPSNKLQYVSTALGFNGKVDHEGHGLWVKCMDGDPEAWERMEAYNKQDVILLEQLYGRFLPWINNHPSMALDGLLNCPKCGSKRLQRRGSEVTAVSTYQRYQCQACGAWSRDVKRQQGAVVREVAA